MHEIFVALLGVALAATFGWAFKALPQAHWQFIGSVPAAADGDGWTAVNLTWYGFWAATAYSLGCALFIVLLASVGVPAGGSLAALTVILLVCVPLSSLIARWVEGTRHGFTVGGASFAGLCLAPAVFASLGALSEQVGFETPLPAALGALSIAYVLGEGVGRLACISFGCCYGLPVERCHGWVRAFSRRRHFVFTGSTKKIAFSSGLEGVPVVPVQAMTASLHGCVALASLWLFLEGRPVWALCASLGPSQLWRAYSETFRADYRGDSEITPYQVMAAVSALAGFAAPLLLSDAASPPPALLYGLRELGSPLVTLSLQAIWVALFAFMGRSTQTGAHLRFKVHADRV